MFKKEAVLGYGIGYFRSIFDLYPHNLFLDLLVSNGVGALLLFVSYTLYSLLNIRLIRNKPMKCFLICIFISWMISMSISLTLWDYAPFWLFFIMVNDCKKFSNVAN